MFHRKISADDNDIYDMLYRKYQLRLVNRIKSLQANERK